MTQTAKFFSYLFHPVFMPLLGILIIFNSGIYAVDIPWDIEKYTYLLVGLFSLLFPISILPLLIYWKIIQTIELTERKERVLPIGITTISLIILHVFISRIIPIRVITAFTFSIAATSILLLFLNMFFKVSMHMLGIGGITGLIIALSITFGINPFFWLAEIIFLTGILASSRLFLKAHSYLEIFTGYGAGLTVMFLFMRIFLL
jgi:hypothetical protein